MAEAARLLLLETSGRGGFVALAEGAALRGLRRLDEARRHARDLAPATAELLAAQGWKARDLHGVVVSRGPGSYTGLRVGIMSAKTLAYAVGCALVGGGHVRRRGRPGAGRSGAAWTCWPTPSRIRSMSSRSVARRRGWRSLNALAVRPFADWLADRAADAWVSGPGLHRWAARAAGRRAGGGCGVVGSAGGELAAAGVGAVHGGGARRPVWAGTAVPAGEFGGGATGAAGRCDGVSDGSGQRPARAKPWLPYGSGDRRSTPTACVHTSFSSTVPALVRSRPTQSWR